MIGNGCRTPHRATGLHYNTVRLTWPRPHTLPCGRERFNCGHYSLREHTDEIVNECKIMGTLFSVPIMSVAASDFICHMKTVSSDTK